LEYSKDVSKDSIDTDCAFLENPDLSPLQNQNEHETKCLYRAKKGFYEKKDRAPRLTPSKESFKLGNSL